VTVTAEPIVLSTEIVQEALRNLPADRLNPYAVAPGEGPDGEDLYLGCVYTAEHDSDEHCIAGQVLTDLGIAVPEWGDELNEGWGIDALVDDLAAAGTVHLDFQHIYTGRHPVIKLLVRAQSLADGGWGADGRKPWGEVIDKLAEEGLL
jgi:hypothetical protein